MRYLWPLYLCLSFALAGLLSACSGEPPLEKAILGTWVQETPFSMTANGLQTTTSDTVLRLKKNGETELSRNLEIVGQGLPQTGIRVSVELRGKWELVDGRLRQTPDTVIIMPRDTDETSREWADKLQAQAEESPVSIKTIVTANNKQLILQDLQSAATDVYKRQ